MFTSQVKKTNNNDYDDTNAETNDYFLYQLITSIWVWVKLNRGYSRVCINTAQNPKQQCHTFKNVEPANVWVFIFKNDIKFIPPRIKTEFLILRNCGKV